MRPSKLLSLALAATLAVFFLTAAVAVPMLCRPYYYAQIDALDLPAQTGWSEQTIRTAYDEVMDYLVYGAPFGTGALRSSASGRAHFADCRVLFRLDLALLGGTSAVLLVIGLLYRRGRLAFHRFWGRGPAFWAAVCLTVAFLLLALWAIRDFDGLFTAFHRVFFPGKTNWIFDPQTDAIICILPTAFWARTGGLVLALCLGGASLTALVAERRARRRGAGR